MIEINLEVSLSDTCTARKLMDDLTNKFFPFIEHVSRAGLRKFWVQFNNKFGTLAR
jgi:hypothetical protein